MHVPAPVPGKTDKHVISDAARTSANSHYDPGMLDRVIRIKQFAPTIPTSSRRQLPSIRFIQSFRHFNVIVHQKVIAAFANFTPKLF